MSTRWEFAAAAAVSLELMTPALVREEADEAISPGTLCLTIGYDEVFALVGTREELRTLAQRITRYVEAEPEDVDPDDERTCANCGDAVLTLSSRDWCDGCEGEA